MGPFLVVDCLFVLSPALLLLEQPELTKCDDDGRQILKWRSTKEQNYKTIHPETTFLDALASLESVRRVMGRVYNFS